MNEHSKLLAEHITTYMNDNNYSLRQVEQISGLSHTYISVLKKGEDPRNSKPIEPTITTLNIIAKITNISLKSLLIKLKYICDDYSETNIKIEQLELENKILNEKINSIKQLVNK